MINPLRVLLGLSPRHSIRPGLVTVPAQEGQTRRDFLRLGLEITAGAVVISPFSLASCGVIESVVPCEVDPQRLLEIIRILSSDSRRIFTPGNEVAEQFIHDALQDSLGDAATVESVAIPISRNDRLNLGSSLPGVNIRELHNVIARISGTAASGQRIIIGAHLDSTGEGINYEFAPGADDNASGVAALLEIARNLQGCQLPFDIELIAFNGEEYNKLGSEAYTEVLRRNDPSILGVIILDTLGGNPLSNRLVLGGNESCEQLINALHHVNNEHSIVSALVHDPSAISNSDHGAFLTKGIPAVMISENGGPGPEGHAYPGNLVVHTAADTMEALNMEAVAKATELTLRFLDFLARDNNWQSPSLGAPTEQPIERLCQNTTTDTEEQPSQTVEIEGMNFLFLGGATALAASPVIPDLAQRLVLRRFRDRPPVPDAIDIIFEIGDCMPMPFGGSAVGIAPGISIDRRVPLSPLPTEFEAVLATVAAHENSHLLYDLNPYSTDPRKEPWLELYYVGKSLGTWDLLDDSVLLLNFYPMAGHPKDGPDEGLATIGMAYTIFSATYRRIIDLLALDHSIMEETLRNEPFVSDALNRVFRIIYDQTPDRIALRQNLIDIYEFIRVGYANEIEFADDFR